MTTESSTKVVSVGPSRPCMSGSPSRRIEDPVTGSPVVGASHVSSTLGRNPSQREGRHRSATARSRAGTAGGPFGRRLRSTPNTRRPAARARTTIRGMARLRRWGGWATSCRIAGSVDPTSATRNCPRPPRDRSHGISDGRIDARPPIAIRAGGRGWPDDGSVGHPPDGMSVAHLGLPASDLVRSP